MEKEDDKLQKIIEIEKQLGEIQDVDVLLERILTETRKIVNADAGSIIAGLNAFVGVVLSLAYSLLFAEPALPQVGSSNPLCR